MSVHRRIQLLRRASLLTTLLAMSGIEQTGRVGQVAEDFRRSGYGPRARRVRDKILARLNGVA